MVASQALFCAKPAPELTPEIGKGGKVDTHHPCAEQHCPNVEVIHVNSPPHWPSALALDGAGDCGRDKTALEAMTVTRRM